MQKEREKTKGPGWFNIPVQEVTEEVKNDLDLLKMRSILDPKHVYKKNDLNHTPKYFQVTSTPIFIRIKPNFQSGWKSSGNPCRLLQRKNPQIPAKANTCWRTASRRWSSSTSEKEIQGHRRYVTPPEKQTFLNNWCKEKHEK